MVPNKRGKVGSNTKRAESRRIRRWKDHVQRAVSTIRPEILLAQEVGDLLLGSLTESKRAYRRAQRRQALTCRLLPEPSGAIEMERVVVAQPNRILSRLNRSNVFPSLVSPVTVIQEPSVSRIVEILRWAVPSMPPHRLLDALATASGFSWEDSAEILLGSRLVSAAIAPNVISVTRAARDFWRAYSAGRERFANLVANGGVANPSGDWASFEHSQIEALLPGIVVPTRLRRHDYLTNAIHAGGEFCLDVHAGLEVRPLFRHPFPNAFSPLHYGRPSCRGSGVN
jgi:hypothetical protein